jgi:hypothetical protein
MSSLIAMPLAGMATKDEALSALPDAPVVAYVEEVPVFRGAREGAAGALRHLADLVAPRHPWVSPPCPE